MLFLLSPNASSIADDLDKLFKNKIFRSLQLDITPVQIIMMELAGKGRACIREGLTKT